MSLKFCNILLRTSLLQVCHVTEAFQAVKDTHCGGLYHCHRNILVCASSQYVVGGIVVDGVLTHCALLDSMSNLKTAQMNLQHGLI